MEKLIKNNRFINFIYRTFGSMLMRIFGLFFKVREDRILLSSGAGKFIGDSPLVIYQELLKNPEFKDYEMVWAVKDVDKYKDDYKVVKLDSLQYFKYALSSRIWISSVNIERGLRFKKKDTVYINTWHGIPLKYVGLDVAARGDCDFSHIDIFIASGEYEREIYQEAFNLSKDQIYITGLPRNIKLEKAARDYNPRKKDQILKELGIENPRDKKIIFLAPTWKDYDYDRLDLTRLADSLGKDYLILFKAHPLEPWEDLDDRVVDASSIDDTVSLLLISDILISDYSSIMIDYSILGRPIFGYTPDYEAYKASRGLYVQEEELAPNIARNEDQLGRMIKEVDLKEEEEKTHIYRKRFISVSSIASDRKIINILREKLGKGVQEYGKN